MTQGIAAITFRVDRVQYEAGQPVTFPDTQFDDFLAVGLVTLPQEAGTLPDTALPVPGDKNARKGSTKGIDL